MKIKKENPNTSTLGACIRLERKKAGLTQAQLGELIGLKESRVSKIENGAPITPEVASFILGKMGSDLQFSVINNREDRATTQFIISIIYQFAKIFNLSLGRAFRYLKMFKGIDYLIRYKDIEQTLSYEDTVQNVYRICAHNGGEL